MPWSRCGLAALLLFARSSATPAAAATPAAVAEQAAAQQPPAAGPDTGSARRTGAESVRARSACARRSRQPLPLPRRAGRRSRRRRPRRPSIQRPVLEKNANLALSVRLRSLLGARGIQVVTTRESDQSVALDRRAEIANHADAGRLHQPAQPPKPAPACTCSSPRSHPPRPPASSPGRPRRPAG